MTLNPTASRLHEEARELRRTADRMLRELELSIDRVTALKRQAARMEERAETLEDLDAAREWIGETATVRSRKAA